MSMLNAGYQNPPKMGRLMLPSISMYIWMGPFVTPMQQGSGVNPTVDSVKQ